MKTQFILALVAVASVRADVIIDGTTNNGGFVSTTINATSTPSGWTAVTGVWVEPGNSTLTSAPFGADTMANSHFIQVNGDNGETLTSNVKFGVTPGTTVNLSFDYKTGGGGADTTLTVILWDSVANTTFATLGTLSTSPAVGSFTQVNYSVTAASANLNLRLRFVLSTAGATAKDFHLDRVHLAGGTITPPDPPAPIVYDTVQQLLLEDTDERIIEKAAKLLPRPNQVAWQRQETTFFIHYGPNSFSGREWGTGTESPSVFNPTALDAAQWVNEIKSAGGRMVMLVVKHHEGFCLWPSRYTSHSVASSPWLGGAGDLARAVSDECHRVGIGFGVYLSPADLYQIKSSGGYYGNGSSTRLSAVPCDPASFTTAPATGRTPPAGKPALTYTVDDYNRYFLNQLYELLTEYGEIGEVWFDGANPDSSTSQTYNRAAWYDLIRQLQPNAVIAVKGPDVRWVGNESGIARDGEWSTLPIPGAPSSYNWGDATAIDLGSRTKLTRGSYLTWYPAEADVPVLNRWFWSPSATARSASNLVGLYYQSVGRNANLLLNVSPDTRGLLPSNQLASLRSMGQVLAQTFATDLAAGGSLTADTTGATQTANLATDDDLDTWWEAASGQTTGTLTLTLPAAVTFDVISLQEAIAQRGQRIESLAVDTWQNGAWVQAAATTNIGHKRLIRLAAPLTSDRVRMRILQSRMEPTLAQVGLFRQADMVTEPGIARDVAGAVTLSAGVGEGIRFTLDGSEPTDVSPLYSSPISLASGGTVKAVAWRTNGSHSLAATKSFGIAPAGWTATADTAQGSNPASYAIDGNHSTIWHTALDGGGQSTPQPHSLTIDMGAVRWLRGFTYLPRQDGSANGTVSSWRCESSENGTSWSSVASGTFGNIKNNPVEQQVIFPQIVHTRFLRFISSAEVNGATFASAAEIGLLAGGYEGWRSSQGLPPGGIGGTAWRDYALAPGEASLPVFTRAADQRGGIRFLRAAGLDDVMYTLEASPALAGEWQAVPSERVVQTGASGMESVELIEISPPADERRFYRLRYSRNP